MNKLEISKDFTIDDIHKIREYNFEVTKTLSSAEQKIYYKNKAESFLKEAGITPKPIMPSQIQNRKIDLRGLMSYAKSKNVSPASLSEQEKKAFMSGV